MVLKAGNSKVKVLADLVSGVRFTDACLPPVSSCCGRSLSAFIRTWILLMRVLSSWANDPQMPQLLTPSQGDYNLNMWIWGTQILSPHQGQRPKVLILWGHWLEGCGEPHSVAFTWVAHFWGRALGSTALPLPEWSCLGLWDASCSPRLACISVPNSTLDIVWWWWWWVYLPPWKSANATNQNVFP